MDVPRALAVGLACVLSLAVVQRVQRVGHAAARERPGALTADVSRAGMRFAPGTALADEQLVERVIAGARPEARALIDAVDGLVTVQVGAATLGGDNAVGLTQGTPHGYLVTLDLGRAWTTGGGRGVQRLVLHELGHVVDAALVPAALAQTLDAQIPAGYEPAPREERFAETFSKWATGDIGLNLALGYRIQPPGDLQAWGAQLVAGVAA